MILTFIPDEESKIIEYTVKPVFHINRIVFVPNDGNDWVNQLSDSYLSISIKALDELGKLIAENQEPLLIGGQITPNHRQPIFIINRFYKFQEVLHQPIQRIKQPTKWVVKLELKNLVLTEGQQLNIDYLDTKQIERRAEDWKNRVHNLIQDITDWLVEEDGFEVRAAKKQRMEEGLMKSFDVPVKEINAADIFKNGKIILAVRPFGLWVMGANGRIDLISAKGNFILVDHAQEFEQPQWKLYQKNNRKEWVEFNKISLLNILS